MSLKNPVTRPGIDPGAVRLVAQRLNHYATPGPKAIECVLLKYCRNQRAEMTTDVCILRLQASQYVYYEICSRCEDFVILSVKIIRITVSWDPPPNSR
jgi:hypothetical protein